MIALLFGFLGGVFVTLGFQNNWEWKRMGTGVVSLAVALLTATGITWPF